MRKIKKKFKKPLRPWDKDRIEEEKKLLQKYGLRRKREIYKSQSILRNYRRRARIIAAKNDKEGEKILLDKLHKMGMLERRDVDLGAVLDLKIDNILDRRLQTIILEMGLANTPLHARQLITHGHIAIDDRRTIFPSYLVPTEIEGKIGYYGKFKLETKLKKKMKVPKEEKVEESQPEKEVKESETKVEEKPKEGE
ncbi:MAG: 30S ribosomal protein S4 [Candidatus Aenigmarchaeota archaeon]|nr:30S ribosomal protein S4 [Candidatus Aenigmarchaeota archaeon]